MMSFRYKNIQSVEHNRKPRDCASFEKAFKSDKAVVAVPNRLTC